METDGNKPTERSAHVIKMGEDKAHTSYKRFGDELCIEDIQTEYQSNSKSSNIPVLFAELYERLSPFAIFIARKLVPSDIASDIVSEVFLRLWKLTDQQLDQIENMKTFVRVCVRNACYNYLTKESSRLRREVAWQYRQQSETPDEFKEEIHATKLLRVHELIDKLPPKRKKIFLMYYVDSLKNREIAEILSVSEQTVRTQKARALKFIRMALLSVSAYIFLRIFT